MFYIDLLSRLSTILVWIVAVRIMPVMVKYLFIYNDDAYGEVPT